MHSRYTHRSSALPEGPLGGLPSPSLTTKGSRVHLEEGRQASRQLCNTSIPHSCYKIFGQGRHCLNPVRILLSSSFTIMPNLVVLCHIMWMYGGYLNILEALKWYKLGPYSIVIIQISKLSDVQMAEPLYLYSYDDSKHIMWSHDIISVNKQIGLLRFLNRNRKPRF